MNTETELVAQKTRTGYCYKWPLTLQKMKELSNKHIFPSSKRQEVL